MSEDEDCDELPLITVNSSANDSSTFAMPSAEELASQRAHELACEEELARLRERDHDHHRTAPLAHSDSSGSEAELALAAAVTALSVQARAAARAEPTAAQLCAALAPRLPPPAAALAEPALLRRLVLGVAAALAGRGPAWSPDELACACAVLCVAALARDSRCRRTAARALHALLDDTASAAQAGELCRVLLDSFPEARTRLQLADVLRSGGEAGADRAADALVVAALLQLLEGPEAGAAGAADEAAASVQRVARAAARWRRLDAAARYTCVQLAGRLLAARGEAARGEEREARATLLAHLAPPVAASDALHPDRLKVLVGASKLRLLFHTEQ